MDEGFQKEKKRKRAYSPRAQALGLSRPYKSPLFKEEAHNREKELKWRDRTFDGSPVASTGQILGSVNLIPQGADQTERIGRRITITALEWKYRMSYQAQDDLAFTGKGDTMRLILFQDKQCNGTEVVLSDVVDSDEGVGELMNQFYRIPNEQRFNILMDETHDLHQHTMTTDNLSNYSFAELTISKCFKKKLNLIIEYDDSFDDGRIETITSNNIGIIAFTKYDAAFIRSTIRIRFIDS